MRKAVFVAFLLMLGSAVLGATVLREPFAWAATPFQNVIVVNDTSAPIPVREQNLDAGGAIQVADQSAREATRYEGNWNPSITSFRAIVPEVPAGQRFVISYVNIRGGSGISGTDLTEASCILLRQTTEGNATITGSVAALPVYFSGSSIAVSEQMTLPVEAREAIDVRCSVQPSPQSLFVSIEIVGNYVPA